jgi:hypothetical protein
VAGYWGTDPEAPVSSVLLLKKKIPKEPKKQKKNNNKKNFVKKPFPKIDFRNSFQRNNLG